MSWTEDLYKDYYDGAWGNYTSFTWGDNTFNWEEWLMNAVVFNDDTTPSTNWRLDRRNITGSKKINELSQLNDPEETFGGDSFDMNEDV